MSTFHIMRYAGSQQKLIPNEFEEALYDSMLVYSTQHLMQAGISTLQSVEDTLQRAMRICLLAGINSKQHFKRVFVFDAGASELYTDWRISKKAFKLTLMQYPSLNREIALWLWELAE